MKAVRTLSDAEIDQLMVDLTEGPAIVDLFEDVRDARNRIIKCWEGWGAQVRVDVRPRGQETILMMEFVG